MAKVLGVLCFGAGVIFATSLPVEAAPLPVGYQARPCSFDLNDDGVIGDPETDCNICDGVTLDPDGDGVNEDLLYVDADAGDDEAGDGSPTSPFRTIQHAWNLSDGPEDGAEDIICFSGTATEEEIIPGTSGVPGVRIKPRSGNEARDWEFPSNPTMLVGWDKDNDYEYPPYDEDDIAVLDGAGNHLDTGLSRAFRIGAANGYLEMAHFTARDYGRYYPVERDEDGNLIDAGSAGFVKFTTGNSGIASHIYLHDLSIENINMDTIGGSHRITFDFFIGHTILHYLALINLNLPNNSSFMNRGSAPSLPGLGRDGRDYGPLRWQNLSVTAHGKDQAPGALGGFFLGWKLWGYMSDLEILDSELDANLDAWNVGTFSVDFVNATQCSRGWTIRNNLLLDVRDALTAQGGNGAFCAHDTVNVPPKSIPRTTDDVVFERNVYINYHDQQGIPVEIKGGDDPQRSVENVTINNNLFVTYADEGFGWCIKAAAANDTGPGNPGTTVVANNTCFGAVQEDGGRGAILIGDSDRPASGQQANLIVKNNLIAGMGTNAARNIDMAHLPSNLQLDANAYDPLGVFSRPGLFSESLDDWQAGNSSDTLSRACSPAFRSVMDSDLRIEPFDDCAKNAGVDLGSLIASDDIDGVSRPQQFAWDIGAYESLEPQPTAAPLRYGGAPSGLLSEGTTEATLSLRTYQFSQCRWSLTPETSFAAMVSDFSSSDGLFHSATLNGLSDGQTYAVFVRCNNSAASNLDDFVINFRIDTPPVTSLVLHWGMNENIGSSVSDSSGNELHAELLNGGRWVAGPIGSALDFDGDNDFVWIRDPGGGWDLDLARALTIAVWVKPATTSGQMKFLSKDNIYELQMGQAGSGRYSLRLNNAGGGVANTPIAAGAWQHLAATWDGETVRYYYNGQADGTANFQAILNSNDQDVGAAARPPGNNFFEGALDEVKLYDGALGPEEVLALYQDTTPPADTEAPLRGSVSPANALPLGSTSTTVSLRTNETATCRFAETSGQAYDAMVQTFATSDGFLHTTFLDDLADGASRAFFVRCRDQIGLTNAEDFFFEVSVLRATPDGFSPADIPDLQFYIQSTVFEDPTTYARSIARCGTQECLEAGNLASIDLQYCDVAQFPEGCIRRWDDLSGYLPLGGFRPPEWVRGRDFGQDDLEKPLFVSDCVNGHPCARGGSGALKPDGSPLPQNFSFEIEVGNTTRLPGAFSIFHLVRPIPQSEDYQYFGLNGLVHRVADDSLSFRTSEATGRITSAAAVLNGAWQLIEVHRAADGRVRCVINGVDVTPNTPVLPGDAAGPNYLSGFKGSAPMFGDLAASLSFDRELGDQERIDIRAYLDEIYDYSSSVPVDTLAPLLSDAEPNGQLPAGTTNATLGVETNEEAVCRFAATSGHDFSTMTAMSADASGRIHQAPLSGLNDDTAYTFFVKCEDTLANRNADDFPISFYIGEPGVSVGLVAHWPFEEGSGLIALNTASASLNADLRNQPTWVEGQQGLAMQFSASNAHGVVTDPGSDSPLDATVGLTIAAWVRPSTVGSGGAVKILSKDNSYEFEIGHAGPGRYSVRLNNARRGTGSSSLVLGAWQHVAVAWDGETVRYFLNGIEDGTAPFSGTLTTNNVDVGIAARPLGASGSAHFRGAMDELRLYDRALSVAEILELATPGHDPGPGCPALPATHCKLPTAPRRSILKINDVEDRRDKLVWKWTRGAATSEEELGNPAAGDNFAFCIYDSVATLGRLLLAKDLTGASTCGVERPCWSAKPGRALYRDSRLTRGAVKKMAIRGGDVGRSKISLLAKGATLAPPPRPLSLEPSLRVQLHNTSTAQCWEAVYSEVDTRSPTRLKAYSN